MTNKEIVASIEHYEFLASKERRIAAWEQRLGIQPTSGSVPGLNRARTYDDAAEALRMRLSDGVERCCCHLIPMEDCRKRTARTAR